MNERVKKWLKDIYHKLIGIEDTPHRKAGGLGLGVFLGVLPGVGPIAALIGATLLRLNKAAALIGSVATNTWLSVVTLALAIKVGFWLIGGQDDPRRETIESLMKDFNWRKLWDRDTLEAMYPLFLGYLIVSLCLGLCVYGITYFILLRRERMRKAPHGK